MIQVRHIDIDRWAVILTVVFIALLTGCRHKDLMEVNGFVGSPLITVSYYWNPFENQLPEGMANLFYPSGTSSGSYWRSDFGPDGGTVRIPHSVYDAISFNNDTENILFSEIGSFHDLIFSPPRSIPETYLPISCRFLLNFSSVSPTGCGRM